MQELEVPAPSTPRGVLDPADEGSQNQRALRDWLRFQAALCLAPVLARDCLEVAGGDPVAALARSGRRCAQGDRQVEAWIRELRRRGIRAVPCTAPAYPPRILALRDPPPLLLVRGNIDDLRRPGVAIVGARAATRYGRGVAEELAGELARAGIVVVSGLARGIDGAAHTAALAGGGRTVAVIGSGLDVVYPPEHRALADRIGRAGAVVSELPLGRPPAAPHFPLRNRLISGLVLAVVVVEARSRSGSLITARHALNQGREVLVVPGPIDSPHAQGSNALLRDGARPVLEPIDVLESISSPFASPGVAEPESSAAPDAPDQARIYGRLREGPTPRDALGRELAWPPGRLALALTGLEIGGWIETERDGRLRAVAPGRRAVREGG